MIESMQKRLLKPMIGPTLTPVDMGTTWEATFNGATGVDLGDILNPASGSFTVSFFARIDASSPTQYLIAKGNNGSIVEGWSIWIGSNDLVCRLNTDGTTAERASQNHTIAAAGEFQHVAMVIDRAAEVVIGYLDGSNSGWANGGGGPGSNSIAGFGPCEPSDHLFIGQDSAAGNRFSGAIKDVRIFGSAKSSSQLLSLRNGSDDTDDLLGRWKLNEGISSGLTVPDSSGNGNDGTIVGSTAEEFWQVA